MTVNCTLWIFGDSIGCGAWDEVGGWVQRLRTEMDLRTINEENYYCFTYNMSVSGDTTEGAIARFEDEVQRRIGEEENIFLFALGANDSQYLIDEDRNLCTDKEFQNNLETLLSLTQKYGDKIGFVGLSPSVEAKVFPMPWAPTKGYKQTDLNHFNDMVQAFCQKNNLPFADVWTEWAQHDYEDWLPDGVHPDARGHECTAKVIRPLLVEWGLLT